MTGSYQYACVTTYNDTLEIEDIGNVAIQIFNDDADSWILVIRTKLGETQILEYGPFNTDEANTSRPTFIACSYKRLEFSEFKIDKAIDAFLNNPKRNISQAFVVEEDEALAVVQNLTEFLDNETC